MQQDLVNAISCLLYDYFVGVTDPDMPKDEYDSEALSLVSNINTCTQGVITAQYISALLSKIFTEAFDEHFSKDMFQDVSQKILDVLKESNATSRAAE